MIGRPVNPSVGDEAVRDEILRLVREQYTSNENAVTEMRLRELDQRLSELETCDDVDRRLIVGGGGAAVPDGCFSISYFTPEPSGDAYPAVVNRYYRRGHLLSELGAGGPPPDVNGLVSPSKPILALVSTMDVGDPETTLESFTDYSSLVRESLDESKSIVPLYLCRFSDDGRYAGIEVDFRSMPVFDAYES